MLRQKAYASETIHTYGGEVIGPIVARSEEDENLFFLAKPRFAMGKSVEMLLAMFSSGTGE